MPTLTARSPLSAVLDSNAGRGILEQTAPEFLESPLTHDLVEFPVLPLLKLVLGDDDPRPDAIVAQLTSVDDPRPIEQEEPAIQPGPGYEPETVERASARLSAPASVVLHRRAEIAITGPSHGNPFVDVELSAVFRSGKHEIEVGGFYDGDGRYLIRFLAPEPGDWTFTTSSSARSLDRLTGAVRVDDGGTPGPVRADGLHFSRADGSVFRPLGTTAYVWTHQSEELQERTLKALASAPFNKLRMCLFPKHFIYNSNDPERFVWQRDADGAFDTTRFDPEYWSRLERRLDQLAELGIEADLILFHPYDRWGFSTQSRAADDRYVRYLTRRLSAFANVWWSLANEYDLLLGKSPDDWERIARLIQSEDHVGHPLSIHNWVDVWDYSSDWATHCSIQRGEQLTKNVGTWRRRWGKPVVVDECGYEGDLDQGWGNLTGEEFLRRAWDIAISGGYVTHGETFYREDDEIWWSKGGELRGDASARLRFLDELIAASPTGRLEPLPSDWDVPWGGVAGEYALLYFGGGRPVFRDVRIPEGMTAHMDVIDTWAMTIEPVAGTHSGLVRVALPARPYCAVRLRAVT
jgi:hypothetical protein